MKRIFSALAACAIMGSAVGPALGHHAFSAEFDARAPVLLRGKVTKMEWVNPHTWVHIEVVDDDGSVTRWMIEGGTPNTLLRAGVDRNTMKPATEIIVRGYQSKDRICKPACKANGRDITFVDGRKIFMGSSGTGAPRDGSDPREGGGEAELPKIDQ